jgi:hypothetical protein
VKRDGRQLCYRAITCGARSCGRIGCKGGLTASVASEMNPDCELLCDSWWRRTPHDGLLRPIGYRHTGTLAAWYQIFKMAGRSGDDAFLITSSMASSSEKLWDVQAILAMRHSAFESGCEVLVAWKPCWIPIDNVPEGPLLSSFQAAPKVRFLSSVGKLLLPVEPNTALSDDVAAADDWSSRQVLQHRETNPSSSSMVLPKRQREDGDGTSRKQLNGVAKKVPLPDPSKQKKMQ